MVFYSHSVAFRSRACGEFGTFFSRCFQFFPGSIVVKALLILLFLVLQPAKSFAAAYDPNSLSIYISTSGSSLNWPGGYRFYWKEIEFGNYAAPYGLCKIFSHDKYYAELGIGLSGFPGIIGGVGYHTLWGLGFGFRADWNAFFGADTSSQTAVTIGFTYTF
jgi:hypothetical protein